MIFTQPYRRAILLILGICALNSVAYAAEVPVTVIPDEPNDSIVDQIESSTQLTNAEKAKIRDMLTQSQAHGEPQRAPSVVLDDESSAD
ncbi:MAG: hypothetical protein P4M08_03015 [Oligoflexia bacterium]|nr:hypothetical protein [Oligoflexia bacterium]